MGLARKLRRQEERAAAKESAKSRKSASKAFLVATCRSCGIGWGEIPDDHLEFCVERIVEVGHFPCAKPGERTFELLVTGKRFTDEGLEGVVVRFESDGTVTLGARVAPAARG